MSDDSYKVVFVGEVIDNRNQDTVKTNLATMFGTGMERIERLFANSPVTIKKNLTRDEALRFRDGIIRAGALCRIENMDGNSEVLVGLSAELTGEQKAIMVCPRCNNTQQKAAICRHCGVIVADYRERHAQNTMPDITETVEAKEERTSSHDRRYHERRQDLEASVNITSSAERRGGLDRRKAHREWHI